MMHVHKIQYNTIVGHYSSRTFIYSFIYSFIHLVQEARPYNIGLHID